MFENIYIKEFLFYSKMEKYYNIEDNRENVEKI
jgi:hypothetical protein